VEIVGEAENGGEALEQIGRLDPDVVFLDIRMPEMDGLSVARAMTEHRSKASPSNSAPHVVFVTAYDEYAVEAFEAAAVDYLLKPIESERLTQSVDRALRLHRTETDAETPTKNLEDLFHALTTKDERPRIAAKSGDTLRLFDPATISRFWAADGYTLFRCDGRKYVLDESITSLTERLAAHGFIRVHRHELINLSSVRAILRIDDGLVVELADNQRASVSRRHGRELKKALGLT